MSEWIWWAALYFFCSQVRPLPHKTKTRRNFQFWFFLCSVRWKWLFHSLSFTNVVRYCLNVLWFIPARETRLAYSIMSRFIQTKKRGKNAGFEEIIFASYGVRCELRNNRLQLWPGPTSLVHVLSSAASIDTCVLPIINMSANSKQGKF